MTRLRGLVILVLAGATLVWIAQVVAPVATIWLARTADQLAGARLLSYFDQRDPAAPGEITSALSSGTNDLLKLGANCIKIDKMFVDAIGSERYSTPIIETLVELTNRMRMEIFAEGVENSNFLVYTGRGHFILTLYEKRVAAADLPFFLALMEHLHARGIRCPQPVKNRNGAVLGHVAGRPAALVTFLDGMLIRPP